MDVPDNEACEPCTVHGCPAGCKCACHWPAAGTGPTWDDYDNHMAGRGPVIVRADAHYHSAFDLGDLLARADAVLAGAAT